MTEVTIARLPTKIFKTNDRKPKRKQKRRN